MRTREIIVPRALIKKFYPHPQPYGDGYRFRQFSVTPKKQLS